MKFYVFVYIFIKFESYIIIIIKYKNCNIISIYYNKDIVLYNCCIKQNLKNPEKFYDKFFI